MSKKKTKKFRAGIKSPIKSASNIESSDATEVQDGDVVNFANELIETKEEKEHKQMLVQYGYVKKDVNKLLMSFGVLAALFVGFFILNTQTSMLTNLGNWIYKIGNFQI